MKTKQQIKYGALLSYISIFLSILTGFLCTPLIIKSLGSSHYGIYTLAFSVINTFLIDFGLGSATSRYVSKYHAKGNQTAVNNIFGLILKLFIAVSLLLGVFFTAWIFLSDFIYVGLTLEELHAFKISFAITTLYSVLCFPFTTFDGVLIAYEKFVQSKLISIINRVVLTIALLICIFLDLGLYSLILCHAAAGVVLIATKLFFVYKYTPARPNFRFKEKGTLKDITTFSIWVTITTLANRLIFNITPSILGIVAISSDIAVFGLIATIESYVYVFATAINGMFLTRITRMYLEKNPTELVEPLLVKIGKYQFFINGLIVCGFIVLGKFFLGWWVGPDYQSAYLGIILVIFPGVFYNALQIANTTMIATKKIKYHAISEIIAGVVNVSLCFPLAHLYGALGACISICIAYIFRTISDNIICIFVLKIKMKRFYRDVYLKMFVPLVVTTALGLYAIKGIEYMGAFTFIRTGVVITAIYCLLSFLFGVSLKERRILFAKFSRK